MQSIAGEAGAELYSNSNGKLDIVSSGATPQLNVGAGCEITSIKTSKDLTCTSDQGGYAIYKHDDFYRKEKKQNFNAFDILGLPVPDCNKQMQTLYEKEMSKEDAKSLERALKMGWLNASWPNWSGLEPYVFIKRGAQAGCGDGIDVFLVPQQLDVGSGHGQNTLPKDVKPTRRCVKVGTVPTQTLPGDANKTIDKLFSCLSPCKLDIEGVGGEIQKEIEFNFKEAHIDGINPKVAEAVGDGKLLVMIYNGKKALICDEEGGGAFSDSSSPFTGGDPLAIAAGSKADLFNVLAELGKTLGRFWIMTGGGAGGGAGLITLREHQQREYDIGDNSSLYWYNPEVSVKETIFSEIFESLYAGYLENLQKKLENGDMGAEKKNQKLVDLSLSQFLQFAAKLKVTATTKKVEDMDLEKELNEAFLAGKGKTNDQLDADAQANADKCKKQDPKGIVILDRQQRGIALPELDNNFQMISGGIEAHADVGASDIVRTLIAQVDCVSMINPCQSNAAAAAGGGNGDPVDPAEEKKAAAAAAAQANCLDASLDAYTPHEDFKVDSGGKGRTKTLNYKEDEVRDHFAARASYPSCNNAYNVNLNYSDISGQVLWRDTDCAGNILPWDKDFNEFAQVSNALNQEVSKMKSSNFTPCTSTTVTTCGDAVAQMPGGGATQDFSVDYGEDGSINTNFTVSGAESRIANNSIKPANHNFNTPIGNQPNAGQPVAPGPNNIESNSPERAARNPLTG